MFGHLSTFGKLVPILPTLQPYSPTLDCDCPAIRTTLQSTILCSMQTARMATQQGFSGL